MANLKGDIPQLGNDYSKRPIQALSPIGNHEQVDGTSATATSTEDYYDGQVVRLVASAFCNFVFGDGPATAGSIYLPADSVEYFTVRGTTKITVLGALLNITVMR